MSEGSASALKVEGLSLSFGGIDALRGVSWEVAIGDLHGLIGPNGAGKSSLVNVISGVLEQSAGTVRLFDESVDHLSAERRARLGFRRTFQQARLFPGRTVLENVMMGAYSVGHAGLVAGLLGTRTERRDTRQALELALEALDRVGLAAQGRRSVDTLTTGEQRLAEVARALVVRPRLLFLDEPAAGLNEMESVELSNSLKELPHEGTTVVMIEHHVEMVMNLCTTVSVLDQGRLILTGEPSRVRRDPRVISAYVGGAVC